MKRALTQRRSQWGARASPLDKKKMPEAEYKARKLSTWPRIFSVGGHLPYQISGYTSALTERFCSHFSM